jgi:large-conductance mechanosensitive channel
MVLIRYLLICVIGYLIIRSFVKFGQQKSSQERREPVRKDKEAQKKVSKEIGEYIDYEEVKKSGGS